MENFVNFFQIFLLIMVRMFAMLSVAPLFSSAVILARMKAFLAFIATAAIFPLVANTTETVPNTLIPYLLIIANEVIIGILLGFLISITFAIFQMTTRFFEVQIGFGITETMDPLAQVSMPVLGQFQNLIAILIFIAIKGPQLIFLALFHSYKRLPILADATGNVLTGNAEAVIGQLITFTTALFSVALRFAFPLIATLFLLSISLGLLAKAAPQMNILILGFPFQVGLGIITYMLLTPMLVHNFIVIIEDNFATIFRLLDSLGGG